MIAIEALCITIKTKLLKELTYEMQIKLLESCKILEKLAFEENT